MTNTKEQRVHPMKPYITLITAVLFLASGLEALSLPYPKRRRPPENLACIGDNPQRIRLMCWCARYAFTSDPNHGGDVFYQYICTPAAITISQRCERQIECDPGDPIPPRDPWVEPNPYLVIMGQPYLF